MYESFVNCESTVAAEAVLAILEGRNQLIFGHKNRFRDAVNQVDGTKVLEEVIGDEEGWWQSCQGSRSCAVEPGA